MPYEFLLLALENSYYLRIVIVVPNLHDSPIYDVNKLHYGKIHRLVGGFVVLVFGCEYTRPRKPNNHILPFSDNIVDRIVKTAEGSKIFCEKLLVLIAVPGMSPYIMADKARRQNSVHICQIEIMESTSKRFVLFQRHVVPFLMLSLLFYRA